jgi:hypothetical protein
MSRTGLAIGPSARCLGSAHHALGPGAWTGIRGELRAPSAVLSDQAVLTHSLITNHQAVSERVSCEP